MRGGGKRERKVFSTGAEIVLLQEQNTEAPCSLPDKPVKYFTPAKVFGLRTGTEWQPEKQEKSDLIQ